MSDEKAGVVKSEIVKAAIEVLPVREAYRDAVQPAARETGKALGHVASVVNSALRPFRSVQIAWDTVFNRLDGWIEEKLKGVPPEQICEPPSNVAGAVATGLLFAYEEPSLRELFVQLLATSMVASTRQRAHPAFAECIKQMTPQEAEIVLALAEGRSLPAVFLRGHSPAATKDYSYWRDPTEQSTDQEIDAMFFMRPMESWSSEDWVTWLDATQSVSGSPLLISAFQNLERLGLVRIREDRHLDTPAAYREIARSRVVQDICRRYREQWQLPSFVKGTIDTTDYGRLFMAACVSQGGLP